jgi:hypothetical protein
VHWLRRRGVERAHQLDADVLAHLDPQATPLADALAALGAAVAAWRHRFPRPTPAWALIGVFTGGRLLGPTPPIDQQPSSGGPDCPPSRDRLNTTPRGTTSMTATT